ncbi:MAG: hypothetical protein HYT98_00310 [Candidatus Sungbacteria bacterium]|nr:hypothetical protein [Candidatus Sungbacteria bacterium]
MIIFFQTLAMIFYIHLIRTGQVEPAFMTWFIFFLAISISLASYLLHENSNWRNNPCNVCDVLYVGLIMVVIIAVNGWKILPLSTFETYCAIAIFLILSIWVWKRNHTAAFFAVQTLLIIGYFPMMEKIITSGNTESFLVWGLIQAANLTGAIAAIMDRKLLPFLYALRAVIMTTITLTLMLIFFRAE